jgi:hypothetical protein
MKAPWCGKMPIPPRWAVGTVMLQFAVVLSGWSQSGSLQRVSAVRAVHVAVSAPSAWSAPELIPAHEVGTGPPQLPAFDANGDAVIVWGESTFSINQVITLAYPVRSAVRPADGHWQPADTLSQLGLAPEVAVDARGDAIAVWQTFSGVQAAIRPAGSSWLASQTVATPGGEEPQVASDPGGDAVVVSPRQAPGQSAGIQAVLRPAGGTFFPAQTISGRENAFHPRIAMNTRGDTLVAWEVDASYGCVVRAALRRAGGRWSAPRTVSDGHGSCGGTHRVAIDERGDAIVVWLSHRGPTTFLEAATKAASGSWTPRHVIARAPIIEAPVQVGMDARGDTLALWSEPALVGGRRTIWALRRPAGRGWEAARTIPHANGGPPSLAIDARGDALVAWQDRRGIEADALPAGGHWRRTYTVSKHEPTVPGAGEDPLAALDGRGDGLVAWQNHEGIKTAWHSSLFP